jgi:hypothetical protein
VTSTPDDGSTNLRDLPPYRAILAVDMKDFSGVEPSRHVELTRQIPRVLERAFVRAGGTEVWEDRRFPSERGDGVVLGFRPQVLPFLVGPFLDSLQAELAHRNELRAARDSVIRMRVSLSVGPTIDTGLARTGDGAGAAIVEACRLLDCGPLRRMLDESHPTVTFVAAILSERVYEDVVEGGYARSTSEFVPAQVKVKRYQRTAYLCAPKWSGGLLAKGGAGVADDAGGQLDFDDLTATDDQTSGQSASHLNLVNGTVHGNVTQYRDFTQHTSGDGNVVVNGNLGGNITNSHRHSKNGR